MVGYQIGFMVGYGFWLPDSVCNTLCVMTMVRIAWCHMFGVRLTPTGKTIQWLMLRAGIKRRCTRELGSSTMEIEAVCQTVPISKATNEGQLVVAVAFVLGGN